MVVLSRMRPRSTRQFLPPSLRLTFRSIPAAYCRVGPTLLLLIFSKLRHWVGTPPTPWKQRRGRAVGGVEMPGRSRGVGGGCSGAHRVRPAFDGRVEVLAIFADLRVRVRPRLRGGAKGGGAKARVGVRARYLLGEDAYDEREARILLREAGKKALDLHLAEMLRTVLEAPTRLHPEVGAEVHAAPLGQFRELCEAIIEPSILDAGKLPRERRRAGWGEVSWGEVGCGRVR